MIGPHITPSKRTSPEEATNSSTSSTLPKSIQTILQREWNFNQGKIGTSFFQLFVLSLPNENAPLGSVNIIFSIRDHSWSAMPWTDLLSITGKALLGTDPRRQNEPDDQTIRWYHRFVLDWEHEKVAKPFVPEKNQSYSEWLQRQAETLQVLVDQDESGCKWGL
jgi:hypothetical protein